MDKFENQICCGETTLGPSQLLESFFSRERFRTAGLGGSRGRNRLCCGESGPVLLRWGGSIVAALAKCSSARITETSFASPQSFVSDSVDRCLWPRLNAEPLSERWLVSRSAAGPPSVPPVGLKKRLIWTCHWRPPR